MPRIFDNIEQDFVSDLCKFLSLLIPQSSLLHPAIKPVAARDPFASGATQLT